MTSNHTCRQCEEQPCPIIAAVYSVEVRGRVNCGCSCHLWHDDAICDHCGASVPTEKIARYGRNPNHDCATSGHYCSTECYDIATGEGNYR